jgi:hypothetical protein
MIISTVKVIVIVKIDLNLIDLFWSSASEANQQQLFRISALQSLQSRIVKAIDWASASTITASAFHSQELSTTGATPDHHAGQTGIGISIRPSRRSEKGSRIPIMVLVGLVVIVRAIVLTMVGLILITIIRRRRWRRGAAWESNRFLRG